MFFADAGLECRVEVVGGCSLSEKQKAKTLTRLQSHTIYSYAEVEKQASSSKLKIGVPQLKRIGVEVCCYHYVIFSLVHLNNSPEKYGASNITLAASKY